MKNNRKKLNTEIKLLDCTLRDGGITITEISQNLKSKITLTIFIPQE